MGWEGKNVDQCCTASHACYLTAVSFESTGTYRLLGASALYLNSWTTFYFWEWGCLGVLTTHYTWVVSSVIRLFALSITRSLHAFSEEGDAYKCSRADIAAHCLSLTILLVPINICKYCNVVIAGLTLLLNGDFVHYVHYKGNITTNQNQRQYNGWRTAY